MHDVLALVNQSLGAERLMHFFTSITSNYLPKARVLAKSVKRHNPDAVFSLVLSDQLPKDVNIEEEPFDSLISIQDLGIPELDSWVFKHRVVELCTAVKGQVFVKIFESSQAEKVIYFDPDIVVLHNLEELSEILEKVSVVLTPHQVEPDVIDSAIKDNEICSLKHGIYNLGFLAVKRNEEGLRFINWWRDRLLSYCYDDIPNGLFTDQRWIDLAPAFFDDIYILRDKTYNVATWNLTHRHVYSNEKKQLLIDASPVKFFHFSGFDSGAQEVMLTKYAKNNEALFGLREWYIDSLAAEGQEELGKMPCKYSYYSNSEPIRDADRMLYRRRIDLIEAFPNPARVCDGDNCYYKWLKNYNKKVDKKEENAVETLKDKLRRSEGKIKEILNSNSWKITYPMRRIKSLIKK